VPGWKVEQSTPPPGQLAGQSGVVFPLQRQREAPASAFPQSHVMAVPAYSQLSPAVGEAAHKPVGGVAGQAALLQLQAAPPSAPSQEQTVDGGYLQPPKLVIVVIVVVVQVPADPAG
jgi:hypothetical protein